MIRKVSRINIMIPVENKMGLCMYIFVGKKKPGMKYP